MCRGHAAGFTAGILLVVIGFLALLGTELVLVLTIPGINYAGADGKAAQAIILATLEFAKPFHISNLNPLEGMGSQMMPMNVWVNPAYWPFAFFDRQVAAELSGLVAFVCYALAVLRDGALLRCAATAEHRRRAAEPHAVWARCAGPRLCGRLRLHPGIGRRLCAAHAGLRPACAAFARSGRRCF